MQALNRGDAMLNKNDRYLEKIGDGRILPWTKRLADRKDMREFFPDFKEQEQAVELFEELIPTAAEEPKVSFEPPEPVLEQPLANGMVTEEFLKTKTKDQLRDYASQVYGETLNPLKKEETMIKNILDLQQKRDFGVE